MLSLAEKQDYNNQQLLRNKLKLKLKYEVNLRFASRPENEKLENEELKSRFTLVGPLYYHTRSYKY